MFKVKTSAWIFFYLISILCALFLLLFVEIGLEKTSLKIINFFVILLFTLFFIKSVKYNGILSVYSLFIFFSVFFIYSRIIFEWIGYLGRQVNDFYFFSTRIHFSDRTVFMFMFYTVFYLVFIDFGFYFSKIKQHKNDILRENRKAKFYIFLFIFLILPLLLYKAYLDIKNVELYGYQSVLDRDTYPFYLKGIGTIFISLFYCAFMFKLTKKEVIILVAVYLFQAFASSLRGSRSVFFIPFVFSIFLLWRLNIIRVKLWQLSVVGLCAILFIAWYTMVLRDEVILDLSVGNILKYICYGQGNSIGLPLYYLEFKDDFDAKIKLPLIIEDWLSFYVQDVFHRGSYYISLIANKKNVEGGLGESFYLELLNLPIFISLLFSYFLGRTFKYIEKNIFSSRFLIPFFLLFSQWLFVIPRFAFFNFLDLYGLCAIFLSFFLYLFFNTFGKYSILIPK